MSNKYSDMIIYGPNGQINLLIQVKNKRGTSHDWAAKVRKNILSHKEIPETNLFLLALPDHFYLWKNSKKLPSGIYPTHDINPIPFLTPYYEKIGIAPEKLSGESFELIISSWINEYQLTDTIPSDIPNETRNLLIDSGIFNAINNGRISSDTKI
ncbi:hypothetical protein MHK_001117 [Candidatus Magnetomorum sp. HK-1]|nr:hypothetical protein MHK_001117 [Candidatus Magnetomorum sp. HK-1]